MGTTRTSLIGLAFLGACAVASGASATDIYKGGESLKDAPTPAPVLSWTGFYLGVNAGKSWGDLSVTDVDGFAGAVGVPGRKTNMEPDGFIGGGTVGYNWQRGMLVLGVEADLGYMGNSAQSRLTGTIRNTFVGIDDGLYGDVTARLGVTAGRALIYAKGGAAFFDGESYFSTDSTNYISHTTTDTFVGWTLGGGVEYALSPSVSLKAEYQYFDFGSQGFTMSSKDGNVPLPRFDEDLTMHTVKAGLNVHLGGGSQAETLK
jgi:outer membrane immunogenic protein